MVKVGETIAITDIGALVASAAKFVEDNKARYSIVKLVHVIREAYPELVGKGHILCLTPFGNTVEFTIREKDDALKSWQMYNGIAMFKGWFQLVDFI